MFSSKQRSKSTSSLLFRRTSMADCVAEAKRVRGISLPNNWRCRRLKGIMKYLTHDESVHSKYGSDRGSGDPGDEENVESSSRDATGEVARRRKVQFADILIREYARTIGDNPSCSSGPPISISWEYDREIKKLTVEQYENNRPPRRSHFEMILPRSVRQEMLRREWNVTQQQIANAVRTNVKIKNQRRATVNNLGKAAKLEEILERTHRGLRRGLFFQKSTTRQAEELRKRAEELEKLRFELFGVGESDDEEEYGTEENPIECEANEDETEGEDKVASSPETKQVCRCGILETELDLATEILPTEHNTVDFHAEDSCDSGTFMEEHLAPEAAKENFSPPNNDNPPNAEPIFVENSWTDKPEIRLGEIQSSSVRFS